MYCPKCAAPINGVKFCRSCGTHVSLVQQAIAERLPKTQTEESNGDVSCNRPSSFARGIRAWGLCLGLLLVALFEILMLLGEEWGIWLLIPSLICLGPSIVGIIRARRVRRLAVPSDLKAALSPTPNTNKLPSGNISRLAPPCSIIESTTRRLGAPPEIAEK